MGGWWVCGLGGYFEFFQIGPFGFHDFGEELVFESVSGYCEVD